MKETELTSRLPQETEIKKKPYAAPKIEAIGAVKDATRGAIGGGADSAGRYKVVSDPNG